MQSEVSLSFGSRPVTEGDSIELTCSVILGLWPAEYTQYLNYIWSSEELGELRGIMNVSAITEHGVIINRYKITNGGRTLAIKSVKYPDDNVFVCRVSEEESQRSSRYVYTLNIRRE